MLATKIKCESVDAYISGFPKNVRDKLQSIRTVIKRAAPEAIETISYRMPAYKLNGILLYFAGYENHIGFYPLTSALKKFKNKISKYKCSKGTIQFPIDEKPPLGLISEIVKYRVSENADKGRKSKGKKAAND